MKILYQRDPVVALVLSVTAAIAAGCGRGAPAPAVEEELRAVNGTELYVKRMGVGEPVVVVHGGPVLEHGYLVRGLAPLADRFQLVFYDQRLSGRSAGTVDGASVTIATFVEDIEALRVALDLGRIHLVGHSWGGLLAMRYAIAHGGRLRSLILLDSMPASSELWQQENAQLAARMTAEDRAERQAVRESEAFGRRSPAALRELLLLSFKPQFHDKARLAQLELYVPDDYMARSEQFGRLAPELADFDLHEDLARLAVPTLVLYGSDEPAASLAGARLKATIPGSELAVVENAGHFPFIEQPEAFQRVLRGFLEARPAS